jgi:hypothetical protein
MSSRLSIAGEGAFFFGRRPEGLIEYATSRRLANNAMKPYKFAYARTALKYGLRAKGFVSEDRVLIPDFICDSIIEPFEELGIRPLYYPVDLALRPIWDQLEQRITPSTKALMIIHYFGQPQQIAKCLDFCREHSILLIEDNAHGFGGYLNGQLLGTFGDLGISAPHKCFPINNGAYLYIKGDEKLDFSLLSLTPTGISSINGRIKSRIKRMPLFVFLMRYKNKITEYKRRNGKSAQYGSQLAFRDSPIIFDYGMDENNELFIENQDIRSIRDTRRGIYSLWHEWVVIKGLVPVFPDLIPGAIPMVFPAFTKSYSDSLWWFEFGHRNGIDIHSWPTLPQGIVEEDGDAMLLWRRMVCFPIHQEMNIEILRRRLIHIE